MAKASFTLPNGTIVEIDGTTDDIQKLLETYGGGPPQPRKKTTRKRSKKTGGKSVTRDPEAAEQNVDLAQIVNLVKTCDEAEQIEEHILDKASQVDRTLLPLYIVHEHLDNVFALTSGEINKITTDLGIPISTANASRTLSGTASRYVIADQVRTRGRVIRYKLSRRGAQYLNSVISGAADGD